MVHVLCIDVLFLQRHRVYVICQRGDRHSSCPSRLEAASDPDARQQPPRSTSQDCRPHSVVSYGSATEVWALLVRLCQYQRARGEVFAVVPLQRAAWVCWQSVVVSEAAAKHCFSLCLTEHQFQTQNLSIFHATQRTGPTDVSHPSRLQKTSSPLASVSVLRRQLYRYSIGFLDVWRTIFAILRTPTRLVTTPHSLL